MDEAGKYQQRLQIIAEKRRMQEEEEKVRREMEEERLKLAQHKRKSEREQWLMEVIPSTTEDPKPQSGIPTTRTKEESAEEQSTETLMKEEMEITDNIKEESAQIGENEPSSHCSDNTEQLVQASLGEEEKNVHEVLGVEAEQSPLPTASQENTEENVTAETEDLKVNQLEHVDPHSLLQYQTPEEAHFSLADRNAELFGAEDNAEVGEEDWEMVNCSPEEGLDLLLTSDMGQKGDDKVLKVFILDEEEGIENGASELLNLVVAEKTSERSREDRTPEDALQTLSLETGAHAGTSAPLQELSKVAGIISKEPCSIVNTERMGDQSVSARRIVTVECKEIPRPESEVIQYVSLDRKREKSPSLLKKGMVAKSTEQESEIQVLVPLSVTPNRAETVTLQKKKTCQCCSVM